MRKYMAICSGTGLSALMMVIGGCDSGERIHDPSTSSRPIIGAVGVDDSSEFDRELIRTKAGNPDPVRRAQAVMNVLDKYGVAYPRTYPPVGPVVAEDADGAKTIGAAAAKVSVAAGFYNPLRRDFTANSDDIETFVYANLPLANGESMGAAAIGNTANVDPFLVAFYSEPGATPRIRVLKVVAYNDDVSGANRSSVINWTNNTGSDQYVTIVAFAYSTPSRGLAHILVNSSRSSENFFDKPIGGLSLYGANPVPQEPGTCVFTGTKMTYATVSGAVHSEVTALVIDNRAMRGGYLRIDHTLLLPWRVDNPYPSFALLFNTPSGLTSAVELIQRDSFNCIQ